MKKSELKKLMKKYLIFQSELEGVFEFCEELLYARAKEVEEEAPYAYNTIDRYKTAAYEVFDLQSYVDEVMERED